MVSVVALCAQVSRDFVHSVHACGLRKPKIVVC